MFPILRRAVLIAAVVCVSGCGSGGNFAPGGSTQGTPQLSVSTGSLSFGSVTVGQTSAAQVVTLTNSGTATLTLSGISLSDPVNYTLTNACGTSLGQSASCTFTVAFKPSGAGSFAASIQVADNAANSPQTIALSGAGTAVLAPQASLSATSLTFAALAAGSASPAQSVTLTNSGTATLSGLSIALGGTNPSVFAMSTNCSSTLNVGATCAVSVTFTPAAASTSYAASLVFTDNSGNVAGATQSVSLTGSGAASVAAPQAVLAPASLTFAATRVGSSAGAQTVALSNPGNATLTGIAISIGGGTASAAFTQATTCGSSLAAGTSCSIAVNFSPSTTGTFAATLSVSDNATGSPQTVALSGIGANPLATLSSSSIVFPTTTVGATSPTSSVTLTNTGNAALTISGVVLGGANASVFAETTTCGASLAAGASCSISVTFTPAAASSYTGSVTLTDNAAGSPQTIALNGAGTTSSILHTLYVFPEADNSVTPLYGLVNNAQKTIDMTMYALQDPTFSADLVAACNRGVTVRVLLDQNNEKSNNTPAFNQLNAVNHCSAVWANKAFQTTHEKSILLDGAQVTIMSLNLQAQYYSTTRDYVLLTNDANDIAAIQATFNADYAAGTTSGGVVGASDFSYAPALGDDLIWSPTTAQAAMLAIINNAKSTLLVENEEMGAANIVSALQAACQRGVSVQIAMVSQSSYGTNFKALEASGCGVHVYPNTPTGFYIHAKAVVADYGMSTQSVYMGSINYSLASMNNNRELGVYISDPASVQTLYSTMAADYAGGTTY